MNIFVMSPDAQLRIDECVKSMLLAYLPNQVKRIEYCDVVVVPITTLEGFVFDQRLAELTMKPWVLLDYTEFSWDYFARFPQSLIFGSEQNHGQIALVGEWLKFDEWARMNPPAIYFKRELLQKDVTDRVKPIEWTSCVELPATETKAQFDARPIEVVHCWGYSHPSRARLHADIFKAMTTHDIDVVSSVTQAELNPTRGTNRMWASIYAPHYARMPIEQVMWLQRRSKLVASLPGAGVKCFRHAEAPVGSIMALPHDEIAWSYPWINEQNCVRLCSPMSLSSYFMNLNARLHHTYDLYPVYLASQETIVKYQPANYVRDYIMPLIAAAI